MELADHVNQYINEKEPWKLAKNEAKRQELHGVLTTAINMFRVLMIFLKPILPETTKKAEAFLRCPAFVWSDLQKQLLEHDIAPYAAMLLRVDPQTIKDIQNIERTATVEQPLDVTVTPTIQYEDFAKIELRIARITHAEYVVGADKLLKLELDIGKETRTVFAGIKSAYIPEKLIGRLTVMVANLAPRKMKFGVSEGMVLAAGPGGKYLWILSPDEGAQTGMLVK